MSSEGCAVLGRGHAGSATGRWGFRVAPARLAHCMLLASMVDDRHNSHGAVTRVKQGMAVMKLL